MVGELTAGSPRVLWGSRRSGGRQQRHYVLPDELKSVRLPLALDLQCVASLCACNERQQEHLFVTVPSTKVLGENLKPPVQLFVAGCRLHSVALSLAGHRGAGDVILDRVAQCQSVWTFAIINKRRNYVFAKTVSVIPRARLEAAPWGVQKYTDIYIYIINHHTPYRITQYKVTRGLYSRATPI